MKEKENDEERFGFFGEYRVFVEDVSLVSISISTSGIRWESESILSGSIQSNSILLLLDM